MGETRRKQPFSSRRIRGNQRSRFTLAVRLPVAPLRPTNRETVEPRAFAWPQLLRPHNKRIAEASSPSAPLPTAVIEVRHRHKYPAQAPVLVPRRPLGRSGDVEDQNLKAGIRDLAPRALSSPGQVVAAAAPSEKRNQPAW